MGKADLKLIDNKRLFHIFLQQLCLHDIIIGNAEITDNFPARAGVPALLPSRPGSMGASDGAAGNIR